MKQDDKKAYFGNFSRWFPDTIKSAMVLLEISITAWLYYGTFTISQVGLKTPQVLANPTSDNTIALKIDNLKQSNQRWIEIDLSEQHLFAWSGKNQTFSAIISTGKLNTPTLPGIFTIQRKYPRDRMRGDNYDISNVPNVLYFNRGYALHGAYWHNNFGTPMSHGCVNLPIGNAQWLFDWAKIGTPVIIHQ